MARTFHRHRHGDENVQSKCQQFFLKIKWRYSKKKKMKCNKGMEIYTNIKSGICFQCKKIGYKTVLKEVFIFILHIDSFKEPNVYNFDHYRDF